MLRPLILLFLMVIVPDTYLWQMYVGDWPLLGQMVFGMTTLVMVLGLIMMPCNWFPHNFSVRLLFGSALCVALPKLVFLMTDLLLPWPLALAAACLVVCCVCYGFFFGWLRLSIRHVSFSFPQLPSSFDGYRILQFSDLHIGTFRQQPRFIRRVVDTILAQQADLIVFTGDLVNQQTCELIPYMAELSRLQAPDGVLSVLGNHDFTKQDKDGVQLTSMQKEMGWQVLNDNHLLLNRGDQRIAMVGVRNIDTGYFKARGDLKKAMEGIPSNIFTILLSHTPTHWRSEVKTCERIPLTLSGHTHGGQMRIGRLSPAFYLYRYWAGSYRSSIGNYLYVSQGLGGTLPFRFIAWPEVTVITLRKGV